MMMQFLQQYLPMVLQMAQQQQETERGRIPSFFKGYNESRGTPTVDNFTGGIESNDPVERVRQHQQAWDETFRPTNLDGLPQGVQAGTLVHMPGQGWGSWMATQAGAHFVPQSGPAPTPIAPVPAPPPTPSPTPQPALQAPIPNTPGVQNPAFQNHLDRMQGRRRQGPGPASLANIFAQRMGVPSPYDVGNL